MDRDRPRRNTAQRRVILEALKQANTHPTAYEVYERVRKRLPRISLGTVYRNLEMLASRGIIQRLDLGGGQRRFDADTEEHYHVRCLQCGKVKDIHVESPLPVEGMGIDSSGYKILGARVEFQGLCPECRVP